MNDYTQVMAVDDLPEGAMTAVMARGHNVLLAHVGDSFYATQEHCPHMGGNLAKGKLDGAVVTCPLHHSQFDVTTGKVVRWTDWTGPLDSVSEAIRHPRPLVTYAVAVADGKVLIGPANPLARE
jgi:3-phenylpropionate/trans-cinnamate dioxygenase ferredoxin component